MLECKIVSCSPSVPCFWFSLSVSWYSSSFSLLPERSDLFSRLCLYYKHVPILLLSFASLPSFSCRPSLHDIDSHSGSRSHSLTHISHSLLHHPGIRGENMPKHQAEPAAAAKTRAHTHTSDSKNKEVPKSAEKGPPYLTQCTHTHSYTRHSQQQQ